MERGQLTERLIGPVDGVGDEYDGDLHFYLKVCSSFYLQTDQINDVITCYFLNTHFSVFVTNYTYDQCVHRCCTTMCVD